MEHNLEKTTKVAGCEENDQLWEGKAVSEREFRQAAL